jgi:hypothetical protein
MAGDQNVCNGDVGCTMNGSELEYIGDYVNKGIRM